MWDQKSTATRDVPACELSRRRSRTVGEGAETGDVGGFLNVMSTCTVCELKSRCWCVAIQDTSNIKRGRRAKERLVCKFVSMFCEAGR